VLGREAKTRRLTRGMVDEGNMRWFNGT